MKNLIVAVALVVTASPAWAGCGTFTREDRPPGEVTAVFDESERILEIRDAHSGVERYDLMGAGTGLAYWDGAPSNQSGENVAVREHKGDLIVDMIVYEPFCE